MEQIKLTGAIYVKLLLISCAPIVKETRIFKQEQTSRELEKELETTFNFLKKIATFTTKPTSQVIVILNSKEEVKNYFDMLLRDR
jgi:hypothetical protein